ncbi:unnamed protein product [Adineta steineri]|uniref:Uncharacterized protein n=1 Tax=Adineta steineri TaxID=433720 RepID=A0A819FAV9_9BILA|nr:unnamed protein product [Adineta steineri]CAF3861621.1 unnamed protein product [Adineta steineri]
MYNQEYDPSDIESLSSGTSNTSVMTSRATTIPNSWSATTLQQKLQQLAQFNIHPLDDDQSSDSTDATVQFITSMNKSLDTTRSNSNQLNGVSTQNQQQQQPWVNPYWGPKLSASATVNQPETNPTNKNGAPQNSLSSDHLDQMIPGSILINDEGEIHDLSWKQDGQLRQSTSSTSFNPGGQYVSDESGGGGGYLAPTHIQRRPIITSTSGQTTHSNNSRPNSSTNVNNGVRSPLKEKQNFPGTTTTTNNNNQPWVNPYWPKSNQNNPEYPQNGNPQPSNNSKRNSETKSPLNTKTTEKSAPPTATRQNPYVNGNGSLKQKKSNIELNNSFVSPRKAPPIPSFYERIYPPPTRVSSPAVSTNKKHERIYSNGKSNVNINDDNDLPYTVDNNGVVHYRATSTTPNLTKKSTTTSQYPVYSSHKSNSTSHSPKPKTSSFSQTTNSANPSVLNHVTSNTFANIGNYHPSSHSNSITILTETDLDSIHEALHLLETNPNAIPLYDPSKHMPTTNINQHSHPLSSISSLFSSKPQQQQQQQQHSNPLSSIAHLFNSNPQQQQQQQQHSNPLSSISHLFTSKPQQQQQQPQQQQQHSNPLSSIAHLFSSKPQQQQQAAFSRNVQYNSQQAPLFSTPSYPSNSNQSLHRFNTLGSATLI